MPISPESLAAPGDEHSHQKAFFQWIALVGAKRWPDALLAHAIPNGSKLMGTGTTAGRIEGAKMKAEGLRAGVPDVMVPVPTTWTVLGQVECRHHGLYIEMKKPGRHRERDGGRSPDQVEWHGKLIRQGYAVATCYGWQAAAATLSLYLSGNLMMPDGGDCYLALELSAPPF